MSVKRISEKYSSNFYHFDFNDKATYGGIDSTSVTFSLGSIGTSIKSKVDPIYYSDKYDVGATVRNRLVGDKLVLETSNANGSPSDGGKVACVLSSSATSTPNISLLMVYKMEDNHVGSQLKSNVWVPDLHLSYIPTIVSPYSGIIGAGSLSLGVTDTTVYTIIPFSFVDHIGPMVDINYTIDFSLDLRAETGTFIITTDTFDIDSYLYTITFDGVYQSLHIEFTNLMVSGDSYVIDIAINYLYNFPLIFIGEDSPNNTKLLITADYAGDWFNIQWGDFQQKFYPPTSLPDLSDFVVLGLRRLGGVVEFSCNGTKAYFDGSGANTTIDSHFLDLGWLPDASGPDFGSVSSNTTSYKVGEIIYTEGPISDLDWKELNSYLLDKWKR